jgi:hypothetical protein
MIREEVLAESPMCFTCKYLFDLTEVINAHSCSAFPMGIPTEIIRGYVTHTDIIEGQVGDFVYEKVVVGE